MLPYRWDYGLSGAHSPFLGALQSQFLVGSNKLELWRLFTNSLKSFPNRRHASQITKNKNKQKEKQTLRIGTLPTPRCQLSDVYPSTITTFTDLSFAMIAQGNKNHNVGAPNTSDSWRGRAWKGWELKLLTASPQRLETSVPVRTPKLGPGWNPGLPAAACWLPPSSTAQTDRICMQTCDVVMQHAKKLQPICLRKQRHLQTLTPADCQGCFIW